MAEQQQLIKIIQEYGNDPMQSFKIVPFLKKGKHIFLQNKEDPFTMLVLAIINNDSEAVKTIIEHCPAQVDQSCGPLNWRPMDFAFRYADPYIIMTIELHTDSRYMKKQGRNWLKQVLQMNRGILLWFLHSEFGSIEQFKKSDVFDLQDISIRWGFCKSDMRILITYGNRIIREAFLLSCLLKDRELPVEDIPSFLPLGKPFWIGYSDLSTKKKHVVMTKLLNLSNGSVNIIENRSCYDFIVEALDCFNVDQIQQWLQCKDFSLNRKQETKLLHLLLFSDRSNPWYLGSEKHVAILKLFLQHGFNPFQVDGKGNRLIDCLELECYWKEFRKRRYALLQRPYSIQDNKRYMIDLLKQAMCQWNRNTFQRLPQNVANSILAFAMLNRRFRYTPGSLLYVPKDICNIIYFYVVCAYVHDRKPLERMLQILPERQLEQLAPVDDSNKRVRKRNRLKAFEKKQQMDQQRYVAKKQKLQQLPNIIAELVCTQTTTGKIIKVPIQKDKITVVGRKTKYAVDIPYNVDMDVTGMNHAHHVSPNHVLIQFDPLANSWGISNIGWAVVGVRRGDIMLPVSPYNWMWLEDNRFSLPQLHLLFEIQCL